MRHPVTCTAALTLTLALSGCSKIYNEAPVVPVAAGWADTADAMDGVEGLHVVASLIVGENVLSSTTDVDLRSGCQWRNREGSVGREVPPSRVKVGDGARPALMVDAADGSASLFMGSELTGGAAAWVAVHPCSLHADLGRTMTVDGDTASVDEDLVDEAVAADLLSLVNSLPLGPFGGQPLKWHANTFVNLATAAPNSLRKNVAPVIIELDERGRVVSLVGVKADDPDRIVVRFDVEYLTSFVGEPIDTSAVMLVPDDEIRSWFTAKQNGIFSLLADGAPGSQ